MKRPLKPGVFGHAQFVRDEDGVRVARLRLDRWWDDSIVLDADGRPADLRYQPLVVIAINPSVACAEFDDNTSANVIEFARRAGANGAVMLNVTPQITTYPSELGTRLMPDGTDDLQWATLKDALDLRSVHVVAAWGKRQRQLASWTDRVARIRRMAEAANVDLMCLGMNGDGSPRHPSRLAYETPIVPWRGKP